ncbi:hypothetical protein EYZ11_005273 [Aspergillus tanneri]|uniref:Uncharacterized protein n=1 Tax=Aspergillus tanneri TaxID=1220188 RepID=A0A4V3UPH8_9EURO|nr:hypothetical protein EYZ11_005273 [Aspergillus tanneri]
MKRRSALALLMQLAMRPGGAEDEGNEIRGIMVKPAGLVV